MGGAKQGTDLLGKYNPGLGAQSFDIDGSAKFIPKGSDLVFNTRPLARRKQTGPRWAGVCEASATDAVLDVAGIARGTQPGDSRGR